MYSTGDEDSLFRDWNTAVTRSKKILLYSPVLFSEFNTIETENNSLTNIHFRTGIKYGINNLCHGILLEKKNKLECSLNDIKEAFDKILLNGIHIHEIDALQLKLDKLLIVKKKAQDYYNETLQMLDDGLITIDVLYNFENKLDRIKLLENNTKIKIEKFKNLPRVTLRNVNKYIRLYREYILSIERYESLLRKNRSWSFDMTGGLDYKINKNNFTSENSVFGKLSINLNMGMVYYNNTEKEIIEKKEQWLNQYFDSYIVKIKKVFDEIKNYEKIQTNYLRSILNKISVYKERYNKFNAIDNKKLWCYKKLLILDMEILYCEQIYLEEHLQLLKRFIDNNI